MAIPEIIRLEKPPSSRIIDPRPKASGYFTKEAKDMTERFMSLMKQHEKEILANKKKLDAILKRKGIKLSDLKKQKGGRFIIQSIKDEYGLGTASASVVERLQRVQASLGTTNPEFANAVGKSFGDVLEEALMSPNSDTARKVFIRWQDNLVTQGGDLLVGHHSAPLKAVWNSLKNVDPKLRPQILTALSEDLGIKVGEGSLEYILNIAHTNMQISKLTKNWQKALGGVNKDWLAKHNPQLVKQLEEVIAHATRFGGTTGVQGGFNLVLPEDLLKGVTDPRKAARLMRPYLDAAWGATEQSIETTKALSKVIFDKKGNLIKSAFDPGGAAEAVVRNIPRINIITPGIVKEMGENAKWSDYHSLRNFNWRQPGFYSGLPLGTVQDHIETAKDIIGRTPKGRLVRGAAVVGGALPILGVGVDAAVAGHAWNRAKNNPNIKNIGAAVGETMILADQVTPFGAVGQVGNQIVRQYTDPDRGPAKIRGRYGAKKAMEAKKAKKLEQTNAASDIWSSVSQRSEKPWLTSAVPRNLIEPIKTYEVPSDPPYVQRFTGPGRSPIMRSTDPTKNLYLFPEA